MKSTVLETFRVSGTRSRGGETHSGVRWRDVSHTLLALSFPETFSFNPTKLGKTGTKTLSRGSEYPHDRRYVPPNPSLKSLVRSLTPSLVSWPPKSPKSHVPYRHTSPGLRISLVLSSWFPTWWVLDESLSVQPDAVVPRRCTPNGVEGHLGVREGTLPQEFSWESGRDSLGHSPSGSTWGCGLEGWDLGPSCPCCVGPSTVGVPSTSGLGPVSP